MERIGEAVNQALEQLGPAASVGRLVEVWPDAVGASIARHAWPARVSRDGTVHVATSSSSWAFELTQLAPTILARLQALAGEVNPRSLRFAPGPLPEPDASEVLEQRDRPRAPSATERAEAARIAAAITDEELSELVARAAAASLAQGAADRSF